MAAELDARMKLLELRPQDPAVRELVLELAKVDRWKEALTWARKAIRAGQPKDVVLLELARGAAAGQRPDRVLRSVDQLSAGGRESRDAVLLRLQALVDSGEREQALRTAERHKVSHPDDTAVSAFLDGLRTREPTVRGLDPLETLAQADRLKDAGFPGRALRLLRRVAMERPGDTQVQDALRRVAAEVRGAGDTLRDIVAELPLPELPATEAPDVEEVLDLDEDLLERVDVVVR